MKSLNFIIELSFNLQIVKKLNFDHDKFHSFLLYNFQKEIQNRLQIQRFQYLSPNLMHNPHFFSTISFLNSCKNPFDLKLEKEIQLFIQQSTFFQLNNPIVSDFFISYSHHLDTMNLGDLYLVLSTLLFLIKDLEPFFENIIPWIFSMEENKFICYLYCLSVLKLLNKNQYIMNKTSSEIVNQWNIFYKQIYKKFQGNPILLQQCLFA
jgi:hypothetical protein